MKHALPLLCSIVLACSSGRTSSRDAATVGAAAVGGALIYRAATGGCWSQCLHGMTCDRETGTCVERPACGGRCAPTEQCEEGAVERCVPILDPGLVHGQPGDAGIGTQTVLKDAGADEG